MQTTATSCKVDVKRTRAKQCGGAGLHIQRKSLPVSVSAGPSEFKQYMRQNKSKPYWQRLADFHLLIYLAKQPGLDLINDIAVLLECIKHKATVPEGYTLIIDSLAES